MKERDRIERDLRRAGARLGMSDAEVVAWAKGWRTGAHQTLARVLYYLRDGIEASDTTRKLGLLLIEHLARPAGEQERRECERLLAHHRGPMPEA